jgi:hypothetical protein
MVTQNLANGFRPGGRVVRYTLASDRMGRSISVLKCRRVRLSNASSRGCGKVEIASRFPRRPWPPSFPQPFSILGANLKSPLPVGRISSDHEWPVWGDPRGHRKRRHPHTASQRSGISLGSCSRVAGHAPDIRRIQWHYRSSMLQA